MGEVKKKGPVRVRRSAMFRKCLSRAHKVMFQGQGLRAVRRQLATNKFDHGE